MGPFVTPPSTCPDSVWATEFVEGVVKWRQRPSELSPFLPTLRSPFPPMPTPTIEVKVTAPVGTIILHHPDRQNALSMGMVQQFQQAVSDLHQEKRVQAIVITGTGDAFCSGRDLLEMASNQQPAINTTPNTLPNALPNYAEWGEQESACCDMLIELLSLPKPVIASVNGPVSGLGVALVLASDIVIASQDASLGLTDTQHGLVAGVVAPLLAYRAGASLAARLLVSGQTFDADEMHRLGLYHEIVEHSLLWARAVEIGKQAATGAPQAIGLTKRLLLETAGEKLLTDLTSGAIASATARTTPAAEEGLQALLEQRPPQWD